jgi:bidirectional [NiFe] hydrogenase diaphorase subunit
MKTVALTIDGKKIKAPGGQKVLWAALDNGIYIPNLCALRERSAPEASCRLCWVEVGGRAVSACTETVEEGMVVNTRGATALRLARTALELLLASNDVDCTNCAASGSCELQKIAAHLKVRLSAKRFRKILRNLPVDDSSPEFIYNPNKCVLCGRCIWVCRRLGIGALGFAYRGFNRRMTTFADEPMAKSNCQGCAQCVAVCPTGALVLKKP